ncbi:MAG: glycosyltransferase family 2 protein, partial [Acidimicrobiales bacterium]
AAAAAALVATTGVTVGRAVAVALVLHGVKTGYSLAAGAAALVVPAPGLPGRCRLPRRLPTAPPPRPAPGPVVLFLPARNEAPRVGSVVAAAPATVAGRPVEVIVVDDGSRDDTAAVAAAAGATVIANPGPHGLGAAVRCGLAAATERGAAAVAFCDADGEYDAAQLADLVEPILRGEAHYVVGTRFGGDIGRMLPHRRFGNLTLTRWVRWLTRRPVTDGQSGYRAFSAEAAAAAVVAHDYNYAQVLTIDLLARGFGYHEVPIRYTFRESGRSFIRLGTYLRHVVPTVWTQLQHLPVVGANGSRSGR